MTTAIWRCRYRFQLRPFSWPLKGLSTSFTPDLLSTKVAEQVLLTLNIAVWAFGTGMAQREDPLMIATERLLFDIKSGCLELVQYHVLAYYLAVTAQLHLAY